MAKTLDRELGAAELDRDDPLVAEALALGWTRYDESFNEDLWCEPEDRTAHGIPDFAGFPLSGSETQLLCCVFDPEKWTISFPAFTEDDSWLFPEEAQALEEKFYKTNSPDDPGGVG